MFPAQNLLYNYLDKGIIYRIKHRLKVTSIYNHINRLFIEIIDTFEPDIIWVFKGMEIYVSSLEYAKLKAIKLVNFNPDNPFVFSGRGSGNSNITSSIKLYDLYFSYSLDIVTQLKRIGVNSMLLPFAYDLPLEVTYDALAAVEEINKVCFIGNPDKERAAIISAIIATGVKVDLFGNNWNSFITDGRATLHQPVYGNDLWFTLRKYRVQLNMLRIHNLTSHNMRTFEIPGVGGIQLAPYTKEHAMFFTPDQSIFLYNNTKEAVAKIVELQSLSIDAADKLRQNAVEQCIKCGYTYKARTNQVYQMLQEL